MTKLHVITKVFMNNNKTCDYTPTYNTLFVH